MPPLRLRSPCPLEAIELVQMLLDTTLHPLYLHCVDGTHVTGAVIMVLR